MYYTNDNLKENSLDNNIIVNTRFEFTKYDEKILFVTYVTSATSLLHTLPADDVE